MAHFEPQSGTNFTMLRQNLPKSSYNHSQKVAEREGLLRHLRSLCSLRRTSFSSLSRCASGLLGCAQMAEKEGFEPPVAFPRQLISSQSHSATLPLLLTKVRDAIVTSYKNQLYFALMSGRFGHCALTAQRAPVQVSLRDNSGELPSPR